MDTVTATLKLVLRDLPPVEERDGFMHMALMQEPRGLPKDATLPPTALRLACPVKQWRTACAKAEQIRASGIPALLIVEAHVSTGQGGLASVVKGIQVVEGKRPATPAPA
jgi:hypothetical protein